MTAHPIPTANLWEWQHEGLCRTTNPETFFHPDGERGPSRRWRDRRAVAVCEQCPVIQQCREHALRVREPYGVWGGLTESEREEILARQDAGEHAPQRLEQDPELEAGRSQDEVRGATRRARSA